MAEKLVQVEGDKLLLFGGVYSNYQALKSLKKYADENGFSSKEIICTGDVVAYCAEPKESVELIEEWGVHCISGNVEIQLRNGDDDCGCNFNDDSSCDFLSKQWYPFAQKSLEKEHLNWMQLLPESLVVEFGGKRWGIVHGSYQETAEFIYKSSPWSQKIQSFEAMNVDHILAGHSGIPFIDQQNGKAWINSGALGMPANDGTSRVWFCTIKRQVDGFLVEFNSLNYAIEVAQKKMIDSQLPIVYSDTLQSGLWHSTEVLRPEEVYLTGKAIELDTCFVSR
jgi:predicted phosphodiesterase